jgi:hypothetical protein
MSSFPRAKTKDRPVHITYPTSAGRPRALIRRDGNRITFGENGDGDSTESFGDWCPAVARNDRARQSPVPLS